MMVRSACVRALGWLGAALSIAVLATCGAAQTPAGTGETGGAPPATTTESSDGPRGPTARETYPHAADLWADKCGACHVPVDPGTRTRATIEAAMGRHRDKKRVELTDDEWSELIEFMAFGSPAMLPPAP